jgi:hypothetical protein
MRGERKEAEAREETIVVGMRGVIAKIRDDRIARNGGMHAFLINL